MNTLMVAVSGGVDSMVLLDLIAHQQRYEVIVAHVDHGIRAESAADAAFVEAVAKKYGLGFISKRFELGEAASEELARNARYDWLLQEANKRDAALATGHHRDDVIGSIAINLTRGTGWRGLAVMNRKGVVRPLLGMTKQQIYNYALAHHLEWVEDETNQSDAYLRNRLRAQTMQLPDSAQETLIKLRNRQIELADEISDEYSKLAHSLAGSRYFLIMIDEGTAIELLRRLIAEVLGALPQRDQAARALLAIKTASPDTVYDVGQGMRLSFSRDRFIVDSHL